MSILRAVARLPYFTGIPEDVATNTFHYNTVAAPTQPQIDAVLAGIVQFYTQEAPTNSVDQYIAPWVSRATDACTVELYNLDDLEPRQPIGSTQFTLGSVSGGGPLPAEAALCLSFRAVFVSGSPNARRRGRVYIGPLSGSAVDPGSAATFPVPNSGLVTTLLASAQDNLFLTPNAESVFWSVYSAADNLARDVVEAWVDNAIDTQRRRGNAPSSRTTMVIA